jgi:hypothetical protein
MRSLISSLWAIPRPLCRYSRRQGWRPIWTTGLSISQKPKVRQHSFRLVVSSGSGIGSKLSLRENIFRTRRRGRGWMNDQLPIARAHPLSPRAHCRARVRGSQSAAKRWSNMQTDLLPIIAALDLDSHIRGAATPPSRFFIYLAFRKYCRSRGRTCADLHEPVVLSIDLMVSRGTGQGDHLSDPFTTVAGPFRTARGIARNDLQTDLS